MEQTASAWTAQSKNELCKAFVPAVAVKTCGVLCVYAWVLNGCVKTDFLLCVIFKEKLEQSNPKGSPQDWRMSCLVLKQLQSHW